MPTKVTFLIPGFADGGAQRQCILLLNALRNDPDLELRLIHFYDGVHFELLNREGLAIQRFDSTSNYDPRNLLRVWRALHRDRPDVLMTWLHACDVYGYVLRKTLPRVAWLMTERDSAYPNELRYNLRRRLGCHADTIIANSEKGAAYWRSNGARCEVRTVSNIVPVMGTGATSLPVQPRIVTVGRLEPQKNPATVAAAFTLLARDNPALDFAVIGAGTEETALRSIIARAGCEERIAFLGFRKDVPDQLSRSTVVVSMSHNEGMPNVLLETVAAGRLAIVSDIPEHRALYGPDYPYYVADRMDPAAVAATVTKALKAPDNTALLDHARRRMEAMTPQVVAQAYKDIIAAAAKRGL
ncbi:hypothetical protein AQZ52_01625 [Novosphingobium fuchskuhlense]|uniref:Glycosyl transferase family 1 domain-containing protein n=1 Tax=Novosphingobium fuchskuhlense TaxID=1117702 RepID=A0A117UZG3_9SPHN|nr:glycosyltransferase [Novosphingobium fuchskuhlense]KUR73694.1 hypothetical protein AQZ52_01625 [Novosphingobium fuchskuhlense]